MKVYVMGNDQRIVRAARISYLKDDNFDRERDIKLLKYLYDNKHASPFEHVIIAFEANKQLYFDLIDKTINNPTIQFYYADKYIFMNLRNYINMYNYIPDYVKRVVQEKLPTVSAIINNENITNYTTDDVVIKNKIELETGFIGLLDKLELGTNMDYYTFVVECPLFIARQWFRHRFGSFNEISRRYTNYSVEFYIPRDFRLQSKQNKQASSYEYLDKEEAQSIYNRIAKLTVNALFEYYNMLDRNIAKEIARGVLPQFMKTRFYWTVPRISLDNFIALRSKENAQYEIRLYAYAIKDMVGYKETEKINIL